MFTTLLLTSVLGQWSPAGACCLQQTSRLDSLLNPMQGNDERFFSRPGGAPNVLFVLDTSENMVAWPEMWPMTNGCGHGYENDYKGTPGLSGASSPAWYEPILVKANANTTAPPYPSSDYVEEWFNNRKVYIVPPVFQLHQSDGGLANPDGGVLYHVPWGKNFNGASPTGADTYSGATAADSITAACLGDTACETCLKDRGYFVRDAGASVTLADGGVVAPDGGVVDAVRIATGNFLNFKGPKHQSVTSVLSSFIRDVQTVRFGIITSTEFSSAKWAGTKGYGSGDDISLAEGFWPTCDKAYPGNDANFPSQRNSILGATMAADNPWGDKAKYTPMLYAAGALFRSSQSNAVDPFKKWDSAPHANWESDNNFKEDKPGKKASVCDACGFSAVILFAGSRMDTSTDNLIDLPNYAAQVAGGPAPGCPSGSNPLCNSKVDEVASWLYRNDFRLDYGGTQRVATYVISFTKDGLTNEVLRNVARQGGGDFFAADNTADLRTRLYDLLGEINNRGQTFATSAVTSVQTGQIQLTQLVPRMYPQRNLPWVGELYRFGQRNEFVDNVDLNGDGDKDDVFNIDADGDVLVETQEGYFMKAVSFTNLTAQDGTDGGGNARPYWEASRALYTDGGTEAWLDRRIFTSLDRTSDSDWNISNDDGTKRFWKANWVELAQHMGLTEANCPKFTIDWSGNFNVTQRGAILDALGLTVTEAASLVDFDSSDTDLSYGIQVCARVVIDYTRGRDLGDEDADGNRDETRASILADIFHSSPVVVEPPPERFLCDLGISNQCARTLYAASLPTTATPLTAGSQADPGACSSVTWTDPYDIYRALNRGRDRVVVVGSNGGMLHVFNSGRLTSQTCSGIAWSGTWDQGSGREEMAFIPPDLLPKLQDMITKRHEYFVDGDVMVRDVWNDDNGDGHKSWDEFHTLVVGSEGRGGSSYFALELRFDTDTGSSTFGKLLHPTPAETRNTTDSRPDETDFNRAVAGYSPYRWMFPQPCTPEATKFGKSLFTLNPKPPAIGPVILKYEAINAPIAGPVTRSVGGTSMDTEERWVVMLSGGWSPGLQKGRGVYMVDAFRGELPTREDGSGEPLDNLIWKAEFLPGASGNDYEPLKHMVSSIVTPVAMVDYGSETMPAQDGFFDTAVFGDTFGQLWVGRMWRPGEFDTGGSGLVENWVVARGFEMDRDAALSGGYKPITKVAPFHYLPSVAIDPLTLQLRAYTGTGNRMALLEPYKGFCRYDNPMACAAYGCGDVEVNYYATRNTQHLEHLANEWDDQSMSKTFSEMYEYHSHSDSACDWSSAGYSDFDIKDCPGPDYDDVGEQDFQCDYFGTPVYHCKRTGSSGSKLKLGDLNDFDLRANEADDNQNDRFFGIALFGGNLPDGGLRYFKEVGAGAPSAKAFDDGRLTDDNTLITDVSNVGCSQRGACDGGAGPMGWYVEYTGTTGGANPYSEKTATGAGIVAGCVLWSTLLPNLQAAGSKTLEQVCSIEVASSRFYASDFQSGTPDCAEGFIQTDGGMPRFLARGVLTPPPEPATVIQVSTTGQVRYSVQLPSPGEGKPFQVNVTGGGDVLQSTYEVPVSRSTHECRHTLNGDCTPVP